MPSSNLGSVDLVDADTGHVNGPYGHDVLNDWIDIATRPASVRSQTHSSAGALSIDADLVAGGHTALVTISANVTSYAMTNMTTGLPFLLILQGNGSASFTVNLSSVKVNATTALNSAVAIGPTDVIAVSIIKLPSGQLWAPGGLLVYNSTSGSSGITPIANGSVTYTGTNVTTLTVPIPVGVIAGDFIEILVATQESTDVGAATTPGGWTQRFSGGHTAAFMPRITKFYKYASGSEGGTNQNISFPVSCRPCGGSQVWRGVHASTPYDNSASAVSTGANNPNPNSVTSVTAGSVATLWVAGNRTGGGTATAPAGYTKTLDQSSFDRSTLIAYKLLGTIGSEDPAAFTWTLDNASVFTDVLRKA